MSSKRFTRIAALAGSSALVLGVLTVSPAHAVSGATCYSEDTVAGTYTLTDDGVTKPIPTASSLAKSAVVVGRSSVAVGLSITTVDDCLGAHAVQALFTSSTGAKRTVNLSYVSSKPGSQQESFDLWTGSIRFSNADRGVWSLSKTTLLPLFGNVVLSLADDSLVADNTTLSPAVTSNMPTVRKISVVAATASTMDAKPEPIRLGKTLIAYASSLKAAGTAFAANKYVPVVLQHRAPGSSVWKTLKSTKTGSTGRAAAVFKPSRKGTWSFRTFTPARWGYASSVSAVDSVSVR